MKYICFVLVFAAVTLFGCKKSTPPSFQFTIEVVDENGTPIQNATVRATAPVVNAIPDFTGQTGIDGIMTDIDGVSLFEYNMPAVLQVTAQKGNNPPAVFGCGYIKLEADSVVNMKIIVLPYVVGVAGC
tara:strand:+ start:2132 stop:2518 length:387 start_codon:yes stop_codon:yes gene_type:complete